MDRGTGILNNTLYIGRLSWNRCSYVKDPRTGKRVARVNAIAEREVVEVPELRIVEQSLWERVRAQQADMRIAVGRDVDGNSLNRAHRRQFLLSGLLTRGCCGGRYTITAKDRYDWATRRIKGTCDNTATILRQRVEARVLAGLKGRQLTPELVAEFVHSFAEEIVASRRHMAQRRSAVERQLAETDRSLSGVIQAIEQGAWSVTLRIRLAELEAHKAALRSELETMGAPVPLIALYPGAAELYRAKVATREGLRNRCSAGSVGDQLSLVAGARNPLYRTRLLALSRRQHGFKSRTGR
jgi:hypothetical protein